MVGNERLREQLIKLEEITKNSFDDFAQINDLLFKMFFTLSKVSTNLLYEDVTDAEREIVSFYFDLTNVDGAVFLGIDKHKNFDEEFISFFNSVQRLSECGAIRTFYDGENCDCEYDSSIVFNFFSAFEEACSYLCQGRLLEAICRVADEGKCYFKYSKQDEITISFIVHDGWVNDVNFAAIESGNDVALVNLDNMEYWYIRIIKKFFYTFKNVSKHILKNEYDLAYKEIKRFTNIYG